MGNADGLKKEEKDWLSDPFGIRSIYEPPSVLSSVTSDSEDDIDAADLPFGAIAKLSASSVVACPVFSGFNAKSLALHRRESDIMFAVGNGSGSVEIIVNYAVGKATFTKQFEGFANAGISGLAFDDCHLLCSSYDGKFRVTDLANLDDFSILYAASNENVKITSMAIGDQNCFRTGDVWLAQSDGRLVRFDSRCAQPCDSYLISSSYLSSVSFCPTKNLLCTCSRSSSNSLVVWDSRMMPIQSSMDGDEPSHLPLAIYGQDSYAVSSSFNPLDPSLILSTNSDQTIRVFRLEDSDRCLNALTTLACSDVSMPHFRPIWHPNIPNVFTVTGHIPSKVMLYESQGEAFRGIDCKGVTHPRIKGRLLDVAFHPKLPVVLSTTSLAEVLIIHLEEKKFIQFEIVRERQKDNLDWLLSGEDSDDDDEEEKASLHEGTSDEEKKTSKFRTREERKALKKRKLEKAAKKKTERKRRFNREENDDADTYEPSCSKWEAEPMKKSARKKRDEMAALPTTALGLKLVSNVKSLSEMADILEKCTSYNNEGGSSARRFCRPSDFPSYRIASVSGHVITGAAVRSTAVHAGESKIICAVGNNRGRIGVLAFSSASHPYHYEFKAHDDNFIGSLAFDHDHLLSCSDDGTFRSLNLYDVRDNFRVLYKSESDCPLVGFDLAGEHMRGDAWIIQADGYLMRLDGRTASPCGEYCLTYRHDSLQTVSVSKTGHLICTSSKTRKRTLTFYDARKLNSKLAKCRALSVWNQPKHSLFASLNPSDETLVLSTSRDSIVRILRLQHHENKSTCNLLAQVELANVCLPAFRPAWHPKGGNLFTVGGLTNKIPVYSSGDESFSSVNCKEFVHNSILGKQFCPIFHPSLPVMISTSGKNKAYVVHFDGR